MASAMLKRTAMVKSAVVKGLRETSRRWAFASIAEGTNLVAAAPNVSLQKARTWDEGVSSKFSTTPRKDIFKGKKVVIFGLPVSIVINHHMKEKQMTVIWLLFIFSNSSWL